jgi:hypothetical protein
MAVVGTGFLQNDVIGRRPRRVQILNFHFGRRVQLVANLLRDGSDQADEQTQGSASRRAYELGCT